MKPHPATPWHVLRCDKGGAAWNMAVDAALLEFAPILGQPVLRFYSWSEAAASFGYFQKHAEVERMTLLRPLVRRPTGGGLVPHDDDWTYSVVCPPAADWYGLKAVESYLRVHRWIRTAFVKLGVPAELAAECRRALPGQCFEGHEKSDVLWRGRKIAGAAQRRTRSGLLIQGSVQPPAGKFLRGDWERAMREVGQAEEGIEWTDFRLTEGLEKRADELAKKVYSQTEYNRRR